MVVVVVIVMMMHHLLMPEGLQPDTIFVTVKLTVYSAAMKVKNNEACSLHRMGKVQPYVLFMGGGHASQQGSSKQCMG